MGVELTQRLATRADFLGGLGIEESRVPQKYLDEPEIDPNTGRLGTIEMWIAFGSAEILRKFGSFMTLPLVSWGADVVGWTCLIAADRGKFYCALPADGAEYRQIVDQTAALRLTLENMKRRDEAPVDIVDSTPAAGPVTRSPRILGYETDQWKMY